MIWFCDQTVGSPLQFIYVYMIGMLFACVLFKPLPYILKVHLYIFKRKHLLRRDGMMLWAWMMFLTREGWWRRREKGRRRRRIWARAILVAVFGAGIQCQFIQQEEKSLRWCVCLWKVSTSFTLLRGRLALLLESTSTRKSNIFLMFLNYFDMLISKMIFKK